MMNTIRIISPSFPALIPLFLLLLFCLHLLHATHLFLGILCFVGSSLHCCVVLCICKSYMIVANVKSPQNARWKKKHHLCYRNFFIVHRDSSWLHEIRSMGSVLLKITSNKKNQNKNKMKNAVEVADKQNTQNNCTQFPRVFNLRRHTLAFLNNLRWLRFQSKLLLPGTKPKWEEDSAGAFSAYIFKLNCTHFY